VIAGSPRNIFRDSLVCSLLVVELLNGCGWSNPAISNQTPNASKLKNWSKTMGAKVHQSKRKQPLTAI